jgi:hypothetical protein
MKFNLLERIDANPTDSNAAADAPAADPTAPEPEAPTAAIPAPETAGLTALQATERYVCMTYIVCMYVCMYVCIFNLRVYSHM